MEITRQDLLSELAEANEAASVITGKMKELRLKAQRLMGKRKTLQKDARMAHTIARGSSKGHQDLLNDVDETNKQVSAITEEMCRLRLKLQLLTAERQRLQQHLSVLDKQPVLARDMRAREGKTKEGG